MSLLGDNACQKDRDRGRGAGTPALEHYMRHGYHTALQAKPTANLEHCMTTMGKSRDPDGSVDRIGDPPSHLWPFLYVVKTECQVYSIDLASLCEEACINPMDRHVGKMPSGKFFMTLNVHIPRHRLRDDQQRVIDQHYGLGPLLQDGTHESISYEDFCEDARRVFTSSPTSNDYQLMSWNSMSTGGGDYQAAMGQQGARMRDWAHGI